nr:hypothetical protein [Lichenibacterium sp. 6Y81]
MLWQGREDSFQVEFPPVGQENFEVKVDRIGQIRFEAWLRRKQRAALLQLSSKLKFRRTPLAGVNVITSLADGSIRDFLEILGSIFEHYARRQKLDPRSSTSLDKFATARTPIAFDIQTDGIYEASEAYVSGVSSRSEREADVLLRFIQGLGTLTSILQSNPNDPRVLGRSERGIFAVTFEGKEEHSSEAANDAVVKSLIRLAEISGYVRAIDVGGGNLDLAGSGPQVITFRLHKRFSPYYHFSFRGAYETVQFHARDFWPLCDRATPVDPTTWANALASRNLSLSFSQLSLPLSTATSDD